MEQEREGLEGKVSYSVSGDLQIVAISVKMSR